MDMDMDIFARYTNPIPILENPFAGLGIGSVQLSASFDSVGSQSESLRVPSS